LHKVPYVRWPAIALNAALIAATSIDGAHYFIDLVGGAAAIIFTLPKDVMLKGASRCLKRMGLFRGDDVSIRYRRLDMRCTRTKTESTITISRSKDQ